MSLTKDDGPNPRKLRIVVVDDNRDAAFTMSILLKASGFNVIAQIYDASEALHCINEQRPDVAILDIAMPRIDGYQLARRVRSEVDPRPMLIALTGLGTDDDKRNAAAAGFDAHLTKPVERSELDALLITYLQQQLAKAALAPAGRNTFDAGLSISQMVRGG
jgi:two-component system CheB/CheR fusion protein